MCVCVCERERESVREREGRRVGGGRDKRQGCSFTHSLENDKLASLDVNNLYSNYLIKIIKNKEEEEKETRRATPIIETNSKFHTQIMTHTNQRKSLQATESVSQLYDLIFKLNRAKGRPYIFVKHTANK